MNFDRSRVYEVVREEIVAVMRNEGMEGIELSDDMSLLDDVGLSSLAMLDVLVGIERGLGVRFENLEAWTEKEALVPIGARFRVTAMVDAVLAGAHVVVQRD